MAGTVPPESGLIAALVVGVCGTAARAGRADALPRLGATVAFSNSQVTSIATAVAGVVIFGDQLGWLAGALGLLSGGAAIVAAWQAQGKDSSVADVERVEAEFKD